MRTAGKLVAGRRRNGRANEGEMLQFLLSMHESRGKGGWVLDEGLDGGLRRWGEIGRDHTSKPFSALESMGSAVCFAALDSEAGLLVTISDSGRAAGYVSKYRAPVPQVDPPPTSFIAFPGCVSFSTTPRPSRLSAAVLRQSCQPFPVLQQQMRAFPPSCNAVGI